MSSDSTTPMDPTASSGDDGSSSGGGASQALMITVLTTNSLSVAGCIAILTLYVALWRSYPRLLGRLSLRLAAAMAAADVLFHVRSISKFYCNFSFFYGTNFLFCLPRRFRSATCQVMAIFLKISCARSLEVFSMRHPACSPYFTLRPSRSTPNSFSYSKNNLIPTAPNGSLASPFYWYSSSVSRILSSVPSFVRELNQIRFTHSGIPTLGAGWYGYDTDYGYCWYSSAGTTRETIQLRVMFTYNFW